MKNTGFTLIELMVVIAIIGILIIVALPSYQNYTRRSHYTEIVQATAPYKVGIEECYQTTGELEPCHAGQNGIPPDIPSGQGSGLIESVLIGNQGVITVTPKKKYGITSENTYILTPSITNNTLEWQASGGGVTAGYAN